MRLSDIKWDPWDVTKPSIWQLAYTQHLMHVCSIDHMDIEFTRKAYTEAISYLIDVKHKIIKSKSHGSINH